MNSFVAFIVKDLLGQASILIAFIAMLGLILQKKSPGKTAEGTFKTLLGFLIMMAGINIIVATLTFLNDIFQGVDLRSTSFSSCQNVSQFGFQFSATRFEEFNVFLGSRNSFTLRDQEVTSIARFNVNLITQATQVCYFIKQNNLHYLILSKSY